MSKCRSRWHGLPYLVDYIGDGHRRPQLDGHVAQALVFHPLGKGFHSQGMSAVTD
ncbi:MAG: hypothetical protein ACYC4H_06565 [Desulfocucumaceae bacterium]